MKKKAIVLQYQLVASYVEQEVEDENEEFDLDKSTHIESMLMPSCGAVPEILTELSYCEQDCKATYLLNDKKEPYEDYNNIAAAFRYRLGLEITALLDSLRCKEMYDSDDPVFLDTEWIRILHEKCNNDQCSLGCKHKRAFQEIVKKRCKACA